MKLRQLQYIVTIADNDLNITEAADRLATCQPGISKQLKLLEEELGFEIFVRNGRSLARVTPAGREAIAHARIILQEAEEIRRACRYVEEEERPSAADGSTPSASRPRSGDAAAVYRGETWNS
ncbi:MAG TPA: LysR family transcriptional regulator [Woeseiaceae bacterium]